MRTVRLLVREPRTRWCSAARGHVRTFTAICGAGAIALATIPLGGCGGPSGELLGSIFSGLTTEINTVITNAGAQAQGSVLAAAGAAQQAVNQAESAFAGDLNNGINNVNETERNTIRNLQAMVKDLESQSAAQIHEALSQAQTLINTIPFANTNPQVSSYSPRFVVAGSKVELKVRGNFVYAYQKKLTPALEVAGATIDPNLLTTQELGFEIPATAFGSPSTSFAPVSARLKVKTEKGFIFKSIEAGEFRLLVTTLPPAPVTQATLFNSTPITGTQVQELTTPSTGQYALESYSSCSNQSAHQFVTADPGWEIIPSSVAAHYSVLRNSQRTKLELTATGVGILIAYSTESDCVFGVSVGSGDMAFNVTYKEQRQTHSVQNTTTPLTIHWGDTLSQPVTRNMWKVAATLFNGHVLEATDTDHSTQYLHIDNNGEAVSESAPAPEEVVEAAMIPSLRKLSQVAGSTTLTVHVSKEGRLKYGH